MSRSIDALQARAEIRKLSRMLGRESAGLDYLEAVPLADLRALRGQITDVLWNADGTAIDKVARPRN